jgi:hypothetical protein
MTTSGPDGSPQRLAIDDLDSLRAGIEILNKSNRDESWLSPEQRREPAASITEDY